MCLLSLQTQAVSRWLTAAGREPALLPQREGVGRNQTRAGERQITSLGLLHFSNLLYFWPVFFDLTVIMFSFFFFFVQVALFFNMYEVSYSSKVRHFHIVFEKISISDWTNLRRFKHECAHRHGLEPWQQVIITCDQPAGLVYNLNIVIFSLYGIEFICRIMRVRLGLEARERA